MLARPPSGVGVPRSTALRRRARVGLVLVVLFALAAASGARPRPQPERRTAVDDYWHYTSVGNMGLTVTNFGILGHGYNTPDRPSATYKYRGGLPREVIEHFSYAGIWIGGKKNGVKHVSTGIFDGVFAFEDGGWEFTSSKTDRIRWNPIFHHLNRIDRRFDFSRVDADSIVVFGGAMNAPIENGIIQFESDTWDTLVTKSSISDASAGSEYAPYARLFDPNAISDQDLVCSYTDTNTVVPGTGITIPNHTPLGVHIYQEAYAWNDPFADAFVILNYTVTNIPTGWEIAEEDTTVNYSGLVSVDYAAGDTIWKGAVIEDPYFGMWVDASVGNMNYTNSYNPQGGPGGRWNWYDNLNDYVDVDPETGDSLRMGIQYDYDGDAGWAQSYLGVKMLGAEPRSEDWQVNYHQWVWTGSDESQNFPMPQDEEQRYDYMGEHREYTGGLPSTEDRQNSWMIFLSCGPMPNLAPGQRFNVAIAVVCGLWNGGGPDSRERRDNLYRNATWAQIAYNGEDRNGNGILDPGEDLDGDGRITRYILPSAPPAPSLFVVPADREVTLYWNDIAEYTIDPITNKRDFEGYRIYGAPKTEALRDSVEWTLLADYDIDYDIDTTDGDNIPIGLNTSLDSIRLDEPLEIEGVEVQYRWVNSGLKNGWPRELYYAVTSYDRGDPANNLPSLESPRSANRVYAFPGTPPTQPGDVRIGVYPNPYIGHARWDGATARERLIWFRYLPADCEVSIFTLAGERVDRFEHHAATYTGGDVEAIGAGARPGERRVFSGGEHAWDLLSDDDQEVATGLYIFTVKDLRTGEVKTGKFLVIK